jgi:hypothetical protein
MYRTPSPPMSIASVSDGALPKPATQPPVRKTTRFNTGLRVHWSRLAGRLGSVVSESVIDAAAESTEASSTYRRYVQKSGRNTPGVTPVDEGPVDEIVVDNQVRSRIFVLFYFS